MRPKSQFQTLGAILNNLLPNAKWHEKRKQYSLFAQWEGIVGATIAKQAFPERWLKNTLVVGVKDSCWLQELRMMENEIVEKIRRAQPEVKIQEIRWRLLR